MWGAHVVFAGKNRAKQSENGSRGRCRALTLSSPANTEQNRAKTIREDDVGRSRCLRGQKQSKKGGAEFM